MRLIHYINESEKKIEINDPDDAIKILKKECSKYLKETKGKWFYKGMRESLNDFILGYKTIRKNREPSGMDPLLFKDFNKWLQKNGHVRRDKSTSMSGSIDHAGFFTAPFVQPKVCFIQGKYDYTWADAPDINQSDYTLSKTIPWYGFFVHDYFTALDKYYFDINGSEHLRDKFDSKKEMGQWIIKNFPKYFHTDKGMQTAWKKGYEIWFKAKGYYFVEANDKNELYNYLKRYL